MSAITDTFLMSKSSDTIIVVPQQPYKAAVWLVATNIGVWSFDRFVLNAPYSRVNFKTIQQNLKTGLVWDNDMFATNLYAHPYHGGVYFNAARSYGLNFCESIPFAASGSLMWEYLLENEPPAVNDLFSTIIGGASLGEMTFRISDLLVDDRTTGFSRFKREALLTLISPVRELNRWISGDAWKHRSTRGNVIPSEPINIYISLGYRILLDELLKNNPVNKATCYDLSLFYGDAYSIENEKPYDYFTLQIGGMVATNQPIINHINAMGKLYSMYYSIKKLNSELVWGVFQHFNYYQAYTKIDNVKFNSYQIAESASIGAGVLFKTQLTDYFSISTALHLNAILMGGSQTDHYKFDKRNYNMGSGFSSKLNFEFLFGNKASVSIHSDYYSIYSWIGLNTNSSEMIDSNVQGDKGNAKFSITSLNLNYPIGKHIQVQAEYDFYYRRSVYDFYPSVNQSISEFKMGIGYVF